MTAPDDVRASGFALVPRDLPKRALEVLAYFDADEVGNSRYEAAEECWGELVTEAAKVPPVLQFTRHIFKPGTNVTVRRGRKWDRVPYALIDLDGESPSMLATLSTLTYQFHQLTDHMLRDEHDPSCRTVEGLFTELSRVYPGFKRTDDVTLVSFYLPAYRAAHADLAGEVRELRGLASSWERFAETMPHGPVGEARRSEAHKCALELSIAIDRFTHQEKP